MKKILTSLALAGIATLAAAQAYPAKPIRLIVGYPPGGGIDFAARTVQVPLQEALKQQIVVDYKPGAGGMLAAGELTRAAPDGNPLCPIPGRPSHVFTHPYASTTCRASGPR